VGEGREELKSESVAARCKMHTRDIRFGFVFLYEPLQESVLSDAQMGRYDLKTDQIER